MVKMMTKNDAYVSQREGAYWVTGSRVSLDSIVYALLNGQTAESIAQSFPVLDLEQVQGAIIFFQLSSTWCGWLGELSYVPALA
jgi:uncharacterized protein (DUF433 family)